jgi:hypothetical protein
VRRAGTSLLILAIAGAIAAGCGGSSSESEVPGGADPDQVAVIKDWADDLRAGDVEAAADHFKLPSIAQNGTPPLQLTTRGQVREFNEALPCGGELTAAQPHGRFILATFELTERPGPGECGGGIGLTAQTAFLIEDGLIAEWRRVDDGGAIAAPSEEPIV